jgi:hypothetical protein
VRDDTGAHVKMHEGSSGGGSARGARGPLSLHLNCISAPLLRLCSLMADPQLPASEGS